MNVEVYVDTDDDTLLLARLRRGLQDRGRTVESVIVLFFQAEDGIRYTSVTGVQTCALPILFCPAKARTLLPCNASGAVGTRWADRIGPAKDGRGGAPSPISTMPSARARPSTTVSRNGPAGMSLPFPKPLPASMTTSDRSLAIWK